MEIFVIHCCTVWAAWIRVPSPRIIISIISSGCNLIVGSASIYIYTDNIEDDSPVGDTPAVVLHSPNMGSFRNICIVYMASLVVI